MKLARKGCIEVEIRTDLLEIGWALQGRSLIWAQVKALFASCKRLSQQFRIIKVDKQPSQKTHELAVLVHRNALAPSKIKLYPDNQNTKNKKNYRYTRRTWRLSSSHGKTGHCVVDIKITREVPKLRLQQQLKETEVISVGLPFCAWPPRHVVAITQVHWLYLACCLCETKSFFHPKKKGRRLRLTYFFFFFNFFLLKSQRHFWVLIPQINSTLPHTPLLATCTLLGFLLGSYQPSTHKFLD